MVDFLVSRSRDFAHGKSPAHAPVVAPGLVAQAEPPTAPALPESFPNVVRMKVRT